MIPFWKVKDVDHVSKPDIFAETRASQKCRPYFKLVCWIPLLSAQDILICCSCCCCCCKITNSGTGTSNSGLDGYRDMYIHKYIYVCCSPQQHWGKGVADGKTYSKKTYFLDLLLWLWASHGCLLLLVLLEVCLLQKMMEHEALSPSS